MIRRLLAFALALALTLTVVGHIPGFEGMAAAQPFSVSTPSGGDAMVVPAGEAILLAAVYDANGCKGSRYGSSGPCSFDAVPSSPSDATPPSHLRATNITTAGARLERLWPSPRLRPPILLS